MYNLAAWGSYRQGWDAMAESAAAGRNAAAACGEAVGRDGRMDSAALENTASTLKAAARAQRRAGAAFRAAAAHARSSAAGQKRAAAAAYAMANGSEGRRAFRGRAAQARRMARAAGRRAEGGH